MYLPKPNEGGSFELAPAGTFVATCYRFIDRGTQQGEYLGKPKTRHEVMLSWELADENMSDGRPFTVSKIYTWSMSDKASLRADLESWRGLRFQEKDFDGPDRFHVGKLIGKSCLLTIVHKARPDGSETSNISAIGKMLKGSSAPPLVSPQVYFALTTDGFNPKLMDNFSDKMREAIQRSPEYRNLVNPQQPDVHDEHPHEGGYGAEPDDMSDIPF